MLNEKSYKREKRLHFNKEFTRRRNSNFKVVYQSQMYTYTYMHIHAYMPKMIRFEGRNKHLYNCS